MKYSELTIKFVKSHEGDEWDEREVTFNKENKTISAVNVNFDEAKEKIIAADTKVYPREIMLFAGVMELLSRGG